VPKGIHPWGLPKQKLEKKKTMQKCRQKSHRGGGKRSIKPLVGVTRRGKRKHQRMDANPLTNSREAEFGGGGRMDGYRRIEEEP